MRLKETYFQTIKIIIMTKQEAIQAMKNGLKVKHYLFDSDEFIHMIDGKIHDENNYLMELRDAKGRIIDFWTDRQGEQWDDGWILLPEKTVHCQGICSANKKECFSYDHTTGKCLTVKNNCEHRNFTY